MEITKYSLKTDKKGINIKIACVTDFHAGDPTGVVEALRGISPDIILLAGDIMEVQNKYMKRRNENAMRLLEDVSQIAECYYCFGNHEIYYSHTRRMENRISDSDMRNEYINIIEKLGIYVVNDRFEEYTQNSGESLKIGGLVCGMDKLPCAQSQFDSKMLADYNACEGYKILLCHYPHYYDRHLKNTTFDLILSGHAHGGQWRIFGQGIYAPHQGLFPKYTSGIYDDRFIISRGASNSAKPIPRIFNPVEILEISVKSSN